MIINLYEVINNPLPKLNIIKEIETEDKDIFKYTDKTVDFLNKYLHMNKLTSESIYAISLSSQLDCNGIIFVAKGTCTSCNNNFRELAQGLLLTGAETFEVYHNHPSGCTEPSDNDCKTTDSYVDLADILGINFEGHYLIAKDTYKECKGKEVDVFGEMIKVGNKKKKDEVNEDIKIFEELKNIGNVKYIK